MSECEICGAKATRKTKIDSAVLNVCDKCVGFGKEITVPKIVEFKKVLPVIDIGNPVKSDFNILIRNARDRMKLTQDDLAKRLSEKLSIIKRVEDGWEPSPALISKLEKFFNIKLTEEVEERTASKKRGKEKLTIGDIVEIR
jgi:putative transcription factor